MSRPISKNPSVLKPINDIYLRLLQLMPEKTKIESKLLDDISHDYALIDTRKKGVKDEYRIRQDWFK